MLSTNIINHPAKIEVNSQGQFLIVGELVFSTTPTIHKRGCQLISASPQPIFNLQNVITSDNSAVALLTSWVRYAKSLNKAVIFIHIPKQLLDIIDVSGLKNILPIKLL